MAIKIDDQNVFQPDASVTCGEDGDDDALILTAPIIVVELLSPSTAARAKLVDDFRLASVRHYLIVRTEQRSAIHHRRNAGDIIETRLIGGGRIELSPPG